MPPTRKTPILIAFGIGFSWFGGAVAALSLLSTIVDEAFLGGVGRYHVHGAPVSATQFLIRSGPVLVGSIPLLVSIALGLYKRRRWSRYVVLAFWAFFGITQLADAAQHAEVEVVKVVPFVVFCLVFSWWYLFHEPNAIEYFNAPPISIEGQEGSHVRPIGVTLLAIALVWLSFGGFFNAGIFLAGKPMPNMSPALVVLETFYGIAAAFAAVDLWRLKPWAPWAFLAWSGCALAFLLGLDLFRPAEETVGRTRGVWVFSLALATLLFALNRYVRGVYARTA
jgi:hypothetical protein